MKAKTDRRIKITVTNPQEIENQKIQCRLAGKETVYDLSAGETKEIEMSVPTGRYEVYVAAAQTFMPDNGDMRELSVVFDLEWQ